MEKYPGLSGLFISGIFSGSLSTVSSAINSLAAVTLEDYIKSFVSVRQESETLILKALAFAYGIGCLLLTFLVEYLGSGVLQASLTIFGVVGGPLLGLFSLGMMTRRANEKGALCGFFTSLLFLFWIGFGGPKPLPTPLPLFSNGTNCQESNFTLLSPEPAKHTVHTNEEIDYFYPFCISYGWYAMIGAVITFLIGYVTSLGFQKTTNLDPNLFIGPIRDTIMSETKQDELLQPIKVTDTK